MKQVAHGMKALGPEHFRKPRTNALDVLHRGGEFQHASRIHQNGIREKVSSEWRVPRSESHTI